MFSEELNKLIEAALVDGVITDKERAVILKRAKAEGADLDEVELLLDAEIQKRMGLSASSNKSNANADNVLKELESKISKAKGEKNIAKTIASFPAPSSKEELLEFIPTMEYRWLHTSASNEDEIKTAYKIKYKEALAKAERLYADDQDFKKLFKKEKSFRNHFKFSRYSSVQVLGCFLSLLFTISILVIAGNYLYKEVDLDNLKLKKYFKFGGYESYQEAARAYDFKAAHKILDELQEDYLSEKSSSKKEKKKDIYDRACDDLFKYEALYLCSKGDKESLDRVVFLLSEFPIEGNALPEGTKYTYDLEFGFHDEEDSQYNQHNLYIKSVSRFNQACNILLDLSIAQHIFSLAEKVLPLFKSVPFPIEDFETDIEATKKSGETIYKRHEMKYSWKEKESAIEKINKAIDDGVFPNVTEHIK